MRTLPLNRRCSRSRFSHGGRGAVRCEEHCLRRSMVIKSKPSESLNPGTDCPIWEMKTLKHIARPEKILTRHDRPFTIFGLLHVHSYRYDASKRRRFDSRGFFCGARSTILEDKRVSAFRNFLIRASAESFSFFVFDTVQSEGTNKLKSRM
jgi:hypothetical protein